MPFPLLIPLIMAGASAAGSYFGSKSGGTSKELQAQQESNLRAYNRLLGLQTSRIQQASPLYQAMLQLAWGMMPTAARQGIAPLNLTSPGTAVYSPVTRPDGSIGPPTVPPRPLPGQAQPRY